MYFDTHAHLDSRQYRGEVDAVLDRAHKAGVNRILCVGFDLNSSRAAVRLASLHGGVYASVGIHPHVAGEVDSKDLLALRELAQSGEVVALGEMGLDFYRDLSPRPLQIEVFRRQLELARELNLPVIIHDREAHDEVMDILEREARGLRVVMHCFSGDPDMAAECVRRGYFLSIAGPVTYPKSALVEVVRSVPLQSLLIETDSPYLPPVPHRGRVNEPAFVRLVAERIAAIKGTSPRQVGLVTTQNALSLFGIGDG